MFTIDLLKGQCIPAKSRPEGIAIAAATFAVPIIIAIVMFGFYLSNIINISIQKREVVRYKKKISQLLAETFNGTDCCSDWTGIN